MPERIGNIHKENASTVFLNYRSKSCECLQPLFKLTLIIFYNEIIIMSDACLNATRLQQNFCPRMRERCSRRGLRRMLLTLYFEDTPYSLFRGCSLLSVSRMLLTLYFEGGNVLHSDKRPSFVCIRFEKQWIDVLLLFTIFSIEDHDILQGLKVEQRTTCPKFFTELLGYATKHKIAQWLLFKIKSKFYHKGWNQSWKFVLAPC